MALYTNTRYDGRNAVGMPNPNLDECLITTPLRKLLAVGTSCRIIWKADPEKLDILYRYADTLHIRRGADVSKDLASRIIDELGWTRYNALRADCGFTIFELVMSKIKSFYDYNIRDKGQNFENWKNQQQQYMKRNTIKVVPSKSSDFIKSNPNTALYRITCSRTSAPEFRIKQTAGKEKCRETSKTPALSSSAASSSLLDTPPKTPSRTASGGTAITKEIDDLKEEIRSLKQALDEAINKTATAESAVDSDVIMMECATATDADSDLDVGRGSVGEINNDSSASRAQGQLRERLFQRARILLAKTNPHEHCPDDEDLLKTARVMEHELLVPLNRMFQQDFQDLLRRYVDVTDMQVNDNDDGADGAVAEGFRNDMRCMISDYRGWNLVGLEWQVNERRSTASTIPFRALSTSPRSARSSPAKTRQTPLEPAELSPCPTPRRRQYMPVVTSRGSLPRACLQTLAESSAGPSHHPSLLTLSDSSGGTPSQICQLMPSPSSTASSPRSPQRTPSESQASHPLQAAERAPSEASQVSPKLEHHQGASSFSSEPAHAPLMSDPSGVGTDGNKTIMRLRVSLALDGNDESHLEASATASICPPSISRFKSTMDMSES